MKRWAITISHPVEIQHPNLIHLDAVEVSFQYGRQTTLGQAEKSCLSYINLFHRVEEVSTNEGPKSSKR